MLIGCLQFAPALGKVKENIAKVDEILSSVTKGELDLLVLPELAFSGYNFSSLEEIEPFLEPTAAGISAAWAKEVAQRLHCTVTIGYPEKATDSFVAETGEDPSIDTMSKLSGVKPGSKEVLYPDNTPPYYSTAKPVTPSSTLRNYNSTVTISSSGDILAHYRKTFLYYTDTTWAAPGPAGFGVAKLPAPIQRTAAFGICMDINPDRFQAPWTDYEFATHVVNSDVKLVVVSMAWLESPLSEDEKALIEMLEQSESDIAREILAAKQKEPQVRTLSYWAERFTPLANRVEGEEVLVVMGNRCGKERDAHYAGSSTVMRFKDGEVGLLDVLGGGEEKLLIVDTEQANKFSFQRRSTEDDSPGSQNK